MRARALRRLGSLRHLVVAEAVLLLVRAVRLLPPDRAIPLGGALARLLSPVLPANGVARDNIAHAFPDATPLERRRILRGSWDSLGRMAVEFVFLDHVARYDAANPEARRIEAVGVERFMEMRDAGRPAILFSAHLANWELLAAVASAYDLDLAALFRPPNNPILARRIDAARGAQMGHLVASTLGASGALSAVLERGGQIGLLVDQRYRRGPAIPFLGRPARTNPTLAKLARRYDCPVYGARCVRLEGGRFRLELVGPIELPRDAEGKIAVEPAMRVVTGIVEAWVREHPEQWLWQHRRWRP